MKVMVFSRTLSQEDHPDVTIVAEPSEKALTAIRRTISDRDFLEPHRTTETIKEPHAVAEEIGRDMNQDLIAESGLQCLLPG
jgi:hypothetical protein